MKRYFLYDTVIQSEKAPSFALSVRALFDFLQLDVPCLKGAKADVGSEVMALNRLKFVEHNAHTHLPLLLKKVALSSVLKAVRLSLCNSHVKPCSMMRVCVNR